MDITIENHGSIFLVRSHTDSGRDWITEHIPDDAQYFGDALAVEHRYIEDIAAGMIDDGLEVE